MSAIITEEFRKGNAQNFVTSVTDNDYFYVGLGKSDPWPLVDDGSNNMVAPTTAPDPDGSYGESEEALKNLIGLKKVRSAFRVIPKNNWISGKVFKAWDPLDPQCSNATANTNTGAVTVWPSYVLNVANNNLYVCKGKANPNDASTVLPAFTDEGAIQTLTDDYQWQNIGEINVNTTFAGSLGFIPVDNIEDIYHPLIPSYYAGIVVGIEQGEGGDFSTNIRYRQVSLIENPSLDGDNADDAVNTLKSITATGDIGLTADDALGYSEQQLEFSNGATVWVDDVVGQEIFYHQNNDSGTVEIPTSLTDNESESYDVILADGSAGGSGFVYNGPYDPSGDGAYTPDTGKVLFLENRLPLTRIPDQTDNIHIIIQF